MRKLFIILFCLLGMMASAEDITVALLEPLTVPGSTECTPMEISMVRGELRKAFARQSGFQPLARMDVDAMLKEQGFQRSGVVDDKQIKEIGKMTSAQYICVSKITKYKTQLYIESYLVDIETGGYGLSATQYANVRNEDYSKLPNACFELAREMLGDLNGSQKGQSHVTPSNKPDNIITPSIEEEEKSKNEIVHTTFEDDVDKNIPITNSKNNNTYVVIIANEKYNETVGIVPFAHNDGEVFQKYCTRTLGISSHQIYVAKDATRNQIENAMDWLKGISNIRSDARFIIYYSGHGVPYDGKAYLLPVDASLDNPQQMWSLKEMYTMLSDMLVSQISVFIDACFSGTRRNGEPLTQDCGVGASACPQNPVHGNIVVLSAAGPKQTAYPFADQQHALFTYYLLKGLQESNGNIQLYQLFNKISENVRREAAMATREQTPCIQISEDLNDEWKKWTLK